METSINPLLILAHGLNGLLMIGMPVALGIYLVRRFKLGWRLWWIGAGTFILSQIGHIPFNAALTQLFVRGLLPAPPDAWKLAFNATILGLSAGLWEELARYATFRWWAKDARSWRKAILLGAGHGGIEAIILGALVLVSFFSMLALRGADLAAVVPAGQLEAASQQIAAYWGATWYDSLLGALERAMSIPVQITLAVLVLQTFTRRQPVWLWLAVLWHAVIDGTVLIVLANWGMYASEAAVGVFSLLSLGILFALRQPEPPAPADDTDLPTIPPGGRPANLDALEDSDDTLERSRYD